MTWNPDQVINFLKQLPPNQELPLEMLTYKLVTLLALASAQRVQTLSLIRVCNIKHIDSGYEIKIPDEIKTSHVNTYQPCLLVPRFPEAPEVCVASVLECYLLATQPIRNNSEQSFLFLTFRKPHKSATTQTISRWIKHTLSLAGIDTDILRHTQLDTQQHLLP